MATGDVKSQGMGRPAPNLAQLAKYNAYLGDAKEVIWQPLYDIQTYAAAGQLNLTYFHTPAGSSSKTYADTNMDMAGQLPAGVNFLCVGIELQFFPAGTIEFTGANNFADDTYKVFKPGSYLEFTLLQKTYLREAPLQVFPQQTGLTGFAGTNITSGTGGSLVEYARLCGPQYQMTPIRIPASQNFAVKITWPAVQTINAAAKLGVRLLGYTYRNAQ
jgi:hypothetical protein